MEQIELSIFKIIYILGIFCSGIYFFYNELKKKRANLLGEWKTPLYDNLRLVFIFITCFLLINKILSKLNLPFREYENTLIYLAINNVFLIAVLIFLSIFFKKDTLFLPFSWKRKNLKTLFKNSITLILASLIPVLISSIIWEFVIAILQNFDLLKQLQEQDVVQIFKNLDGTYWKILFLFSAAILAPVYEEILFRATIYRKLKSYINPFVAMGISSFLFALIHFNILNFLPLFTLGFIFAYAYEKTGDIRTSIIMHALWNANTLFLLN